jgi:hypothetical protein
MMITQPVLQRQTVKQAAMHFIAVKNVIGAMPTPVNRDEFTLRAQSIGQTPGHHGQRFDIEVITHFAEHNQIELSSLGEKVEIRAQIAALNSNVVQAGAAHACPLRRRL